jgi:hypothetical protein
VGDATTREGEEGRGEEGSEKRREEKTKPSDIFLIFYSFCSASLFPI